MTSPTVHTAHDVPDLIGVLPTCFGFVPQESLCVIATSGPRCRFGLSMRMNLPETPAQLEVVVQSIAYHLGRQDADGAIVIAVSERPDLAERAVLATEAALEVPPVVCAWATSSRYWTTYPDADPDGHPYVASDHDLAVVRAVAEGQEILATRAQLEERFAPAAGERARWLSAAVDDVALDIATALNRAGGDVAAAGRAAVMPLLDRSLAGEPMSDDTALRLCVWVSSIQVRDQVWERMRRHNARDMLRVWAQVARTAPSPFEPGPLCLAAWSAHLLGDGAQALIALERALRLDPDYSMATLLLQGLQGGLHPDVLDTLWERRRATSR